jgi:biopolymer transport protein ExbB/TolQ
VLSTPALGQSYNGPSAEEIRDAGTVLRAKHTLHGPAHKSGRRDKKFKLLAARRLARRGLEILASAATLRAAVMELAPMPSPVARLAAAAAEEAVRSDGLDSEGVKDRASLLLSRIEAQAGRTITRGIGILATIGATAVFVGLFGTVWGIMDSFIRISRTNTTNLAVVAPGIAEALLATAMGLVAAIPAVVIRRLTRRRKLARLPAARLRLPFRARLLALPRRKWQARSRLRAR